MTATVATTVRDVIAALDAIAPPHLCLGDDPRGLLVGDVGAAVTRIVVALDVTLPVAKAAAASGAEMAVAHHPLIYHPLRAVRTDDPHPGAVVHECIRSGIAVACAHTNWDVADGGVNDVLTGLLALTEARPLQVTRRDPLVKVAVLSYFINRFNSSTPNKPSMATMVSIKDHERIVSLIVRLKYSLNNQNPESLT